MNAAFERRLVGIGAAHSGEDLIKAFGSRLEDPVLQSREPFGGGEISDSRSVYKSSDHLGALGRLDQTRVVVTNRYRCDLGEAERVGLISLHIWVSCHLPIKESVPISINDTFLRSGSSKSVQR